MHDSKPPAGYERRWTQAEAIAENERARKYVPQSAIDIGYGQFRGDLIQRIMRHKLTPKQVAGILTDASAMFRDKGLVEEAATLARYERWRDVPEFPRPTW